MNGHGEAFELNSLFYQEQKSYSFKGLSQMDRFNY